MHRAALLILAVFALPACPGPGGSAKPGASACTKPGQQCKLPAGGLGVCTRAADQSKFDCVSQH